jgi:predicted PurR-regulated permease PerM
MITEEIILSIYAVLLLEVGLLLLLLILIVVNIKSTIDSIRQVIHKFVKLGNMTADTAEDLKSKLTSLSGIYSTVNKITDIFSSFSNLSNKSKEVDSEVLNKEEDDLEKALSKVSAPKKKRRII